MENKPKKIRIEDLPVRITYSDKKVDMDNIYRILCKIIRREMEKDYQESKNNKKD